MKTKRLTLNFHDYKYFPYEEELAVREAVKLLKPRSIVRENNHLELKGNFHLHDVRRLVYFNSGCAAGSSLISLQSELEGSDIVENGRNKRRQSTRYSVHGLHEYKGKFNPQIVRGILNILGVPLTATVFDPFCGSGTTLLECTHVGMTSVGVDRNPLAVFMANAKLQALATPVSHLERLLSRLLAEYQVGEACFDVSEEEAPRREYLRRWFNEDTMLCLEKLRYCIEKVAGDHSPIFFAVASNLLRDYSLQEPADLRIRRRKSPLPTIPFIRTYETSAVSLLNKVKTAQSILGVLERKSSAYLADSRSIDLRALNLGKTFRFDVAITSPPYATALPYIDTQRLSLVWLRLCSPKSLSFLEADLIGSRETKKAISKHQMLHAMLNNSAELPEEHAIFCKNLQDSLSDVDGFRRRAVPVLLYRYFSDMQAVFRETQGLLRKRGQFALVVGRNQTVLGGTRFLIDTPSLLASLASYNGWVTEETVGLQTYHRYGLHQRNSVNAEDLIILRRS